ncbi:MAG TPA: response regulator transcription factor [Anaerolineae bacterium]|nr:response regulator transcription factor [Anaerolineae bacterium]
MTRILLVDDQPAVRQGLRMRLALEADLRVVGEANSATEALVIAQILHPDVVVMDVEMPGIDGIQATEALRVLAPWSTVVVLSIHDDAVIRQRARTAGAAAFVGKHGSQDELLAAIRQAQRLNDPPPFDRGAFHRFSDDEKAGNA